MLTENLIASIAAPAKAPNTSVPKDAGIFLHEVQPRPGQRHLYKKSATPPNCLAVSATHIFAAQAEKAVVHVYNREKGNQEAIVPFPERIHAVALAADDSVLVLGTESGRVLLWEICTGRLVAAPVSHLQRVTAIAVEPSSNHLLTGSADSSINVWSLPHLLSFSSSIEARSPIRSLSSHRDAITSLVVGHGSSTTNIAVSVSRDKTALVWDYQTGVVKRTYLLGDAPISLCLDGADRAFYAGYEDGSVQLVDFYDTTQRTSRNTLHSTSTTGASSVVEPLKASRWSIPPADNFILGATECLALSWDSTTLLSGHKSGRICTWEISQGRWGTTLDTLPGPVTNLQMLPPTGAPNTPTPSTRIQAIIKPRPETSSKEDASGPVPGAYTLTTQFARPLPPPILSLSTSTPPTDTFASALTHPTFPPSFLDAGLAELYSWTSTKAPTSTTAPALDSDYMSLDTSNAPALPALTEAERIQDLEDRLGALQRVQRVTFTQLAELRQERDSWRAAGGASTAGTSTPGAKVNGTASTAPPTSRDQAKIDDDMDVDSDVGGDEARDAEEIDIDARLKYYNSSDEEWPEEGQARKKTTTTRKKEKRRAKSGK